MQLDEKEEKYLSRLKKKTSIWLWIVQGCVACLMLLLLWQKVERTKYGIAFGVEAFIPFALYFSGWIFGVIILSSRIKKLLIIIDRLKEPDPGATADRDASLRLAPNPPEKK